MKPEIMWAIVGVHGLYCGTWLRRKDAINQHCRDKGATWRHCRKRGDRAVRVVVSLNGSEPMHSPNAQIANEMLSVSGERKETDAKH